MNAQCCMWIVDSTWVVILVSGPYLVISFFSTVYYLSVFKINWFKLRLCSVFEVTSQPPLFSTEMMPCLVYPCMILTHSLRNAAWMDLGSTAATPGRCGFKNTRAWNVCQWADRENVQKYFVSPAAVFLCDVMRSRRRDGAFSQRLLSYRSLANQGNRRYTSIL